MKKVIKLNSAVPVRIQRKRVAAYARVSVETEEPLHSLSAQVSHYSGLIQGNPEWEYAGVYVDEGVTGTSIAHRMEFRRLIEDCDAGKIDVILTKSISRFARDTVDCLNTIRHLKDIGVEVRFEREGISTFTADGELLLTLLASFAQAESESISANVRWSIRKRFEEGIPNLHKPPYGYRWDGEKYRIVPEQGDVVKVIFRRYLAGESAYSIAKALKERGIVGQYGIPMHESTIKDIISNISYTGTMILQKHYISENHKRKRNRGELTRYAVDDMYEPLVSVEEYEQAVLIREKRAAEASNAHVVLTRFSGLMKCGHCGCGISRRNFRKEKRWECNTRARKGSDVCDMQPLMETELIDAAAVVFGDTTDDEFRMLVQRIIIHGDRIEFVTAAGKIKAVTRKYGRFNAKCAFSGKVICGICGSVLRRKTGSRRSTPHEKIISWGCTAPRTTCKLYRILEVHLLQATENALATNDAQPAFAEHVRRALVFNDRVQFELKDGTIRTWDRSSEKQNRAGKEEASWPNE